MRCVLVPSAGLALAGAASPGRTSSVYGARSGSSAAAEPLAGRRPPQFLEPAPATLDRADDGARRQLASGLESGLANGNPCTSKKEASNNKGRAEHGDADRGASIRPVGPETRPPQQRERPATAPSAPALQRLGAAGRLSPLPSYPRWTSQSSLDPNFLRLARSNGPPGSRSFPTRSYIDALSSPTLQIPLSDFSCLLPSAPVHSSSLPLAAPASRVTPPPVASRSVLVLSTHSLSDTPPHPPPPFTMSVVELKTPVTGAFKLNTGL